MSTVLDKRNLAGEFESAFNRGKSVNAAKQKAMDAFLLKGLPDGKSEEYRFTPIAKALEKIIAPGSLTSENTPTSTASLQLIQDLRCNILAFVNGSYSRERSVILDEAIQIRLGDEIKNTQEADPFELLNKAFAPQDLEISIDSKKEIQHPLAIVHVIDSNQFVFASPRWRLVVGSNSSVSVLEYGVSPASAYFNNKQTQIEVGENASLEYTAVQNGPAHDFQVNNTHIQCASNARIACFTVTLDGLMIRNNLSVMIDGEGVDAHLHGIYMISNNTLADNHTVVDHRKPNSYSNELYKGIMNGRAKGVFNGKIFVRPDAQKTNAFQSNRNILLGESANVFTKPQLEIWADDVKCSHGCTTGQLDEEALFYLRSRGIPKDMARNMLLYAFASETLSTMKNEVLKNFLDVQITEKLQMNF